MKQDLDRFSEVTQSDVNDARSQQQPLTLPPPPPQRNQIRRGVLLGLLIVALAGFTLGLLTSAYVHGTAQSVMTPSKPRSTSQSSSSPASPTTPATCQGQVTINDTAGVLDKTQVCREAAMLGYPISIYTTTTSTGGDGDFDQQVRELVTGPRMIVFAITIDMEHNHVHAALSGGIDVPLADHHYHEAVDAFNHDFHTSEDYTSATIAALRSLQSSLEES